MPLFLLTLWGKFKYYLLGAGVGLLGLVVLIFYERKQGANNVREGDRQEIINATSEVQAHEMAIANNGLSLPDKHKQLLAQRDQLRKLLQSR